MNPINDDLKLVASKIMGWPEWVDENKDPASLPAWWINDLGILIVERSEGSDLWNPIKYDDDSHELLGRLVESLGETIHLKYSKSFKVWNVTLGTISGAGMTFSGAGMTLNAALFAFAVKLASELAKEGKL